MDIDDRADQIKSRGWLLTATQDAVAHNPYVQDILPTMKVVDALLRYCKNSDVGLIKLNGMMQDLQAASVDNRVLAAKITSFIDNVNSIAAKAKDKIVRLGPQAAADAATGVDRQGHDFV